MEKSLPIIKNFDDLATSKLKMDALTILEEGFESIIVEKLIKSKVLMEDGTICIKDEKICLSDFKRVFLIAIGKCAVSSATALEEVLGDNISGGIVLDVKEGKFKHLVSEVGTHPLPSEKNVFVANSIVDILKQADKNDLILTVISGGGSSLMCLPDKISCDEQSEITHMLMKKGATISELNTIRKHTSKIKAGFLAKLAYPSTIVSFIFSDVPDDDISLVASGPTVMDKTTIKDAEKVLEKFGMSEYKKALIETPKEKKYFEKVRNIVLGSNKVALESMKKKAEELGYDTYIESSNFQGDARVVSREIISKKYLPNSCHLWGGETTVIVDKKGKGGRNQEFALSALPYIPDNTVLIACASDGWDNTDMAGAIADNLLYEKAISGGLDPEEWMVENKSYDFFHQVGGHIRTGRLGSNVSDFYLILKGGENLEEDDERYDESALEEDFEEDEKEINSLENL